MRLDVRNLSVVRNGKEILRNLSLSLLAGELVALLGPSGSGKSTLLKAMLGLVRPARGDVRVSGRELRAHMDTFRRALGYVPQEDILHDALTVEKTVRYAAELRLPERSAAARDAAVTAVLAHVGLSDRRGVRVKSLSGGQKKRVSVAVELLARPPLFFLDEPTSGLDPALEEKMMQLFRTLTDSSRLMVVTTHVLASLDRVDLAVIIAGGHLVYVGPPKEAPAFFEVPDLASIYRTLAAQPARGFAERLERSSFYRTYVLDRLAAPPPPFPGKPSSSDVTSSAETRAA